MSCLSSHEGRVYIHIHKRTDDKRYWACKIDNPKLAFENGLAENVCMAHAYLPSEFVETAHTLAQQFDGTIASIEAIPCDNPNFFTPEMRKTLNLA